MLFHSDLHCPYIIQLLTEESNCHRLGLVVAWVATMGKGWASPPASSWCGWGRNR